MSQEEEQMSTLTQHRLLKLTMVFLRIQDILQKICCIMATINEKLVTPQKSHSAQGSSSLSHSTRMSTRRQKSLAKWYCPDSLLRGFFTYINLILGIKLKGLKCSPLDEFSCQVLTYSSILPSLHQIININEN